MIGEILFRGKRTDNGKFVYGGICDYGGGIAILEVSHYEGSLYEPPSTEVDEIEVVRESVGQFTGLRDKNGEMVFEGDIIRHKTDFTNKKSKTALGVIRLGTYESKSGSKEIGFYIEWHDKLYSGMMRNDIQFWIEDGGNEPAVVIGNIHDYPNLLKGEGQ